MAGLEEGMRSEEVKKDKPDQSKDKNKNIITAIDTKKAEDNSHKFEEYLKENAANAEKLTKNFLQAEEKEFTTGIEGSNKINKLRSTLNPFLDQVNDTKNPTKIDKQDQEGLKALDKFLNDCLQKNDIVQGHNKYIVQILKKLDNGEGRDINIDEKNIKLENATIAGENVNLEYNVDGNDVVFSVGKGGINIVKGELKINDQYRSIKKDDKGSFKLEISEIGFLNELAGYEVSGNVKRSEGNEKVVDNGKGYKVNMINNINKEPFTFELDENGLINGADSRQEGDYKISIDQKGKKFNITDTKAAEKLKTKNEADKATQKAEEDKKNKEIMQLDLGKMVDGKIAELKGDQETEAKKRTTEGFTNAAKISTTITGLESLRDNYSKTKNELTKNYEDKITTLKNEQDREASKKTQDGYNKAGEIAKQIKEIDSTKANFENLELTMKKQASEDKREDVTKTWKQIDELINPQVAPDNAGAVVTTPEIDATGLTKESVINTIKDSELKSWYEKKDSKSQLEAIINLLKEENGDSAEIKQKKTELSALLADGDTVGFQEELGLKKGVNADQADGKLGKYTLDIVTEILTTKTGEASEGAVEGKNTDVKLEDIENEREDEFSKMNFKQKQEKYKEITDRLNENPNPNELHDKETKNLYLNQKNFLEKNSPSLQAISKFETRNKDLSLDNEWQNTVTKMNYITLNLIDENNISINSNNINGLKLDITDFINKKIPGLKEFTNEKDFLNCIHMINFINTNYGSKLVEQKYKNNPFSFSGTSGDSLYFAEKGQMDYTSATVGLASKVAEYGLDRDDFIKYLNNNYKPKNGDQLAFGGGSFGGGGAGSSF